MDTLDGFDVSCEVRVLDEAARLRLVADLARLTADGGPLSILDVAVRCADTFDVDVIGHVTVHGTALGRSTVVGGVIPDGLSLTDLPWCAAAVEGRTTVQVVDAATDWRFPDAAETIVLGLQSGVVVPVFADREVIGVLLGGSTTQTWDDGLRPALETISSLLGSAVQRRRTASTQERLLTTDPETGMANAARLLRWLGTGSEDRDLVLVRLAAVDDIHTAYGPREATAFLVACAEILQQTFGVPVARMGSNELGLLVVATGSERELAETVAATLRCPVGAPGGLRALPDPAVGVARTTRGTTPGTGLGRARTALSTATRLKHHRAVAYEERFTSDTATALGRALTLEQAVRDGEMSIHVQPGRRFTDRSPRWAEILVRFDHPDLAAVPVGTLIANAERSGAVSRLGTQVMRLAAALDARLRAGGTPIDLLSINLSALQLQETSLAEDLAAVIIDAGGVPDDFAVELTESVAMSTSASAAAVLEALHDQGFSIVIDDFGAGSVAMHRLLDLPFDVLKIERSLLRGTEDDESRRTVLASSIRLGLDLGKLVIVGGVETLEQARMVRDMGADVAQGFWVARPQPPELGVLELADWGVWAPADPAP